MNETSENWAKLLDNRATYKATYLNIFDTNDGANPDLCIIIIKLDFWTI